MSTTDLFGKPLGQGPVVRLTKWQKRQAALLYHFASLDYLKGLKKLVDDFVSGVDITLDLAQQQGRDELIVNSQWGVRDTSVNFSTYGFPALQDFEKSLVKDIALRAKESYEFSGYIQCARLIGELGMGWATPGEEARFEAGMEVIGRYAAHLDNTMRRLWSDGIVFNVWGSYRAQFPRLPKFRVRTDVVGESERLPGRTGVYVPQDDPYGTLQFAWTGNKDGRLFECRAFNDLGLEAVNLLGREGLWGGDDLRLLALVKQPKYRDAFLAEKPRMIDEKRYLADPVGVNGFISSEGISDRSCKWYFVELIDGEFDDETQDDLANQELNHGRLRCPAGQPCPQTGYWLTPAKSDLRRHFKQGEAMPDLGSDYGVTIWQWDEQQ
ncbi:MAG TPA: hypothetical protein VLC92_21405 [Rhodocyclaceae bacterium]|nr:hypothetical protein [Rhodocyclaceae bacterium]